MNSTSPPQKPTRVANGARKIPLSQLHAAPWSVNRTSRRLQRKIKRSVEEFGFVENLVARPHPTRKGHFEVISGNHRLPILRRLGVETAPVYVVELGDDDARLLAQTLNRTRGRDDPRAYQLLIAELEDQLGAEQVERLLPDNSNAVEHRARRERDVSLDPDPDVFGVIVACSSEHDQAELLELLAGEGLSCRALL